jgi:hypothetical protein
MESAPKLDSGALGVVRSTLRAHDMSSVLAVDASSDMDVSRVAPLCKCDPRMEMSGYGGYMCKHRTVATGVDSIGWCRLWLAGLGGSSISACSLLIGAVCSLMLLLRDGPFAQSILSRGVYWLLRHRSDRSTDRCLML